MSLHVIFKLRIIKIRASAPNRLFLALRAQLGAYSTTDHVSGDSRAYCTSTRRVAGSPVKALGGSCIATRGDHGGDTRYNSGDGGFWSEEGGMEEGCFETTA